ncbi:metallophosphoesterase family protein [Pseudonocardia endophytica]|uniref:Icc-related predicted phosphoesterase n=1 Tax=Pseudonocardia endophytica TaxID=401976 RepID=A0A4R1I4X3_PSEEN|nr:metallophosphoesterase [Pseudonocardia endophytica]TCK25072.1 Icc-related predicted phosphoesterase [Pseudonocardia endophytica]
MRLHVVSDVHGNDRALARAADGADGLIVLGDLLEFVDYRNPELGIMGRLLGAEVTAAFTRLRGSGERAAMVELLEDAWSRFDNPREVVREEVAAHYARTFAVLDKFDVPVWAIPGNVDMPEIWPTDTSVSLVDNSVDVIDGLRFGFVGGVPLPPGMPARNSGPWQPHFIVDEEFDATVSALGPVDVLCSHAPPGVPDLAYDVVARRREGASPALRNRIAVDRPSHSLFGHVHQPLAQRRRVGDTECVNVGHFRLTEQPYVLRW